MSTMTCLPFHQVNTAQLSRAASNPNPETCLLSPLNFVDKVIIQATIHTRDILLAVLLVSSLVDMVVEMFLEMALSLIHMLIMAFLEMSIASLLPSNP